jgi:hypothetical protein
MEIPLSSKPKLLKAARNNQLEFRARARELEF